MNKFFLLINKMFKSVVFIISLISISILIISIKISNEKPDNPYCDNLYNNEKINLLYDEIISYEYRYDCSTMFFEIVVDDKLERKDIVSLLMTITLDLSEYDCFIHYQVTNNMLDKPIYASVDKDKKQLFLL